MLTIGILAALASACLGGGPTMAAASFDCVMTASRTVLVGSRVAGVLDEVSVERGDFVHRGDVIARIEASVETATVSLQKLRATDDSRIEAQRARLGLARRQMDRARRLLPKGTIPRAKFEEINADLQVNMAELERLQKEKRLMEMELARSKAELELRLIRSPIDGLVTSRVLSAGEFVHQEAHVVELARLDPLYVEVFLPAPYYPQIALGDTARITPDQPPGASFPAEVIVIDQVFDATSNTFGVRLSLPNPKNALPGGQRCRVTFDAEGKGGALDRLVSEEHL